MPGVGRTHEISVQDYRLHYLSLSARHGSMRAAADLLNVAPSSISRQIKLLERALSIDLVEKGSHKMQLTEAGQLLIDYYDRRMEEHQDLLVRLAELRNTRTRLIRIAATEGLLAPNFLSELSTVSEKHPDTHFDLSFVASEEVQRMVLSDVAQIGLLIDTPEAVRLKIHAILPQPLALIMPADHAFTRRDRVTPEEVAKQRLVLTDSGSRLFEIVQSIFNQQGLDLDIVLKSASLQPILDAVTAGLGLTILPPILVADRLREGSLVQRPIDCDKFSATSLFLVSRIGRRQNQPTIDLINSLRREIQACG